MHLRLLIRGYVFRLKKRWTLEALLHFPFSPSLIGESARLRDYVTSLGVLESVLQLLQGNYSKLVLRRAYWILQNFLRTKDPPLPLAHVQKILPVVCQLLDNDDAKVCPLTVEILDNLSHIH